MVQYWYQKASKFPLYDDAAYVLRATKCVTSEKFFGLLDAGHYPCNYIYGTPLIWITRFIANTPANVSFIAVAFGVGTVLVVASALASYLRSSRWPWITLGAAAAATASAPMQLLFEHANFDALILGLLFFAAILTRTRLWGFALVALAAAAVFKFYPVTALFAWSFLVASREKKRAGFATTAIAALVIAFELILRKPTIPEDLAAGFGAHSLALWLAYTLHLIGSHLTIPGALINLFSLLVTIALAYKVSTSSLVASREEILGPEGAGRENFGTVLGSLSGVLFITCSLVGENYDYKLVFLVVSALFVYSRAPLSNKQAVIFAALTFAAFAFSYNLGKLGPMPGAVLEMAGDFAIQLLASLGLGLIWSFYYSRHLTLRATP